MFLIGKEDIGRPEFGLNFWNTNKLPVILQSEMAECGLSCIAMIACYHGFKTDLLSLRVRFSVSSHGLSLHDLILIAEKLNMLCRALKLEAENINELQTPCILHWGMNHFVVLKAARKGGYVIHDPAKGRRFVSTNEMDKHFTGIALEVSPTSNFVLGEETKKLKLSQFWTKITGLKRSLATIFCFSLLLQLFALVTPLFQQLVIDDVVMRQDTNILFVLAAGFTLLLIIENFTTVLREYAIVRLSNLINVQMAANIFRHLLRLKGDFFAKRQMGDIVSRFSSLQGIRDLLSTSLVAAILDGLMAIITLTMMLYYDITLTAIVIIASCIYTVIRATTYKTVRDLNEEVIAARAKENSHFIETIRAIETIKIFNSENSRQHQWQNHLVNMLNRGISISSWNIGFRTANNLLFGFENILIIYFAALSIITGSFSVGMLFAFIAYKFRFESAFGSLITNWISIKMVDVHLSRLAEIAYAPTEKDIPDEGIVLAKPHNTNRDLVNVEINIRGVSYRYSDNEPYVLKDVNLEVAPGERLAIVGPSGFGKTTLLKIVLGLIEPESGQVTINGRPVACSQNKRNKITAVMQNDALMNGTIAENISAFESDTDMAQVERCAKLACIHEDIMRLPMGYHTLVGESGAGLSGGQLQRLAIARALYPNPKIIAMDEATSHLDVKNEQQINRNLSKLGITCIVVAHRPETISAATRVVDIQTISKSDTSIVGQV